MLIVVIVNFYLRRIYAELVIGRVHPWVGLGWVGSKTMGHFTQSVSIDDVYKLNISYQCIKQWHRRDLRCSSSSWLDISALRTLYYWLNNNGTLERLLFRFYCWVGLVGWVWNLEGWVGLGLRKWTHDQLWIYDIWQPAPLQHSTVHTAQNKSVLLYIDHNELDCAVFYVPSNTV